VKRPNSGVHISQGSAETLVKRGGISNNHSIAYSSVISLPKITKIGGCALMCVEVIVCNVSVVFLDTVYNILVKINLVFFTEKLKNLDFRV